MAYNPNDRDQFIALDSGRIIIEDGHSFCFSCSQDRLRTVSMKERDGKYVVSFTFVDDSCIEVGKMCTYKDGALVVKRVSSAIDWHLDVCVVIDEWIGTSGFRGIEFNG